jgi:ATP-binding cassette subfamily C (CFTR/MRP) protein 1
MSARLQRPFLPHYFSEDSYLTATNQRGQPLCGNIEGWGPLSPFRWDFTPCFLDVWVALIAAFGIVGGIGAIIYLKRQPSQPVKKNWHFYLKLVCLLRMALVMTEADFNS